MAWMPIPSFSFFVPPPSPVVASLISPIPFPTFLVFSPAIHVRGLGSTAMQASHSAQQKWQPVAKVGGDQIQLVSLISRF